MCYIIFFCEKEDLESIIKLRVREIGLNKDMIGSNIL